MWTWDMKSRVVCGCALPSCRKPHCLRNKAKHCTKYGVGQMQELYKLPATRMWCKGRFETEIHGDLKTKEKYDSASFGTPCYRVMVAYSHVRWLERMIGSDVDLLRIISRFRQWRDWWLVSLPFPARASTIAKHHRRNSSKPTAESDHHPGANHPEVICWLGGTYCQVGHKDQRTWGYVLSTRLHPFMGL